MAYLIACFIIALIIYFGAYYEKDKKAMEQRGKTRPGKQDEDHFIFPFLDEHQKTPQINRPDSSGTADHGHEDHFED